MPGSGAAPEKRRLARRAAAVLLGFIIAFVGIEASLRVASFIEVRAAMRRMGFESGGDRRLVAFAGDSNIYGLYCNPEETVSKAVSRLAAGAGSPIYTINLGLPSAPSWAVVEQVKRAAALKPAAIFVTCGINNLSSIPPGEGLGPFEDFRIVKLTRKLYFNWRYRDAYRFRLDQGVGGAPVENGMTAKESKTVAFTAAPRDGDAAPLEVERIEESLPFDKIRGRLRLDLAKMARVAKDAGAKLFYTSYLAGNDPGFREITELMRMMDGQDGARFLDTTTIVSNCLQLVDGADSRPSNVERHYAARAQLLTCDYHPTPFGYEAQARIIIKALAEGEITKTAPDGGVDAFIKSKNFPIPRIEASSGSYANFNIINIEPEDRLTLLIGVKGHCAYGSAELSIDMEPVSKRIGRATALSMTAKGGPDGTANINIPFDTLQKIHGPFQVLCFVERGGLRGATRVLMSPAVPLNVP